MADRWYYAHENAKMGPFSGRQMVDLAVAGQILRTDTVWKEGVEKGVLAQKVQHLFPLALAEAAPVKNGVPTTAASSSSRPTDRTASPVDPAAVVRPEAAQPADDARPTADELRTGEGPEEDESAASALPVYPAPAAMPDNIQLQAEAQAPAPLTQKKPAPQQPPVRKLRAVVIKGATIVGQDGTSVKFRKKCTECGHEDSSYNTLRITTGGMNAVLFCPKCRKKQEVKLQGLQG